MKKIFLCLLIMFLSFVIVRTNVNAYYATGHDDFSQIIFENEDDVLLINRSSEEIKEAYDSLKKGKLIGWRTQYLNINSKASYIGNIIFTRSNRTSSPFNMTYRLNTDSYVSKSIKINGSVSGKIANNSKKIELSLSPKFDVTYNKVITSSTEEEWKFELTILPQTKVTLLVTGDAYVTSGVSKYYFLGLCLKKGEWERVDVETVYYELIEEKL